MFKIAEYEPSDYTKNASNEVWNVWVEFNSEPHSLYGTAIITEYGGINTRPSQIYHSYIFYTTDVSVAGTKATVYFRSNVRDGTDGQGLIVKDTDHKWKSITSTEGYTYYYLALIRPRVRDKAEQYDYNNTQYAGAGFTNVYDDERTEIIDHGETTTPDDWDEYPQTGIDYLEEIYGPDEPYVPPGPISAGYGQGIVTLNIDAKGQNLTFTSSLLAKSVTQFISGDATVNIEGDIRLNWEILFSANFSVAARTIYINSDFIGKYYYPDTIAGAHEVVGELIEEDNSPSPGLRFRNVVAKATIIGLTGIVGTGDTSLLSDTYNQGDTLPNTSSYGRITIAKRSASVSMPFEIGFHWDEGGPAESAILKRDSTFIGWVTNPIIGEYLTIYNNRFINTPFSGTLKCFVVYNLQTDDSGVWLTLDASTANTITAPFFIVFAIPE